MTIKLNTKLFVVAVTMMAYLEVMAAENDTTIDRVTGLVQAEGWQQVQANCTECHTAQLITQNSGTRAVWASRITWMQDTQGLGELNPATENIILDYLAANYGPKNASRRPNLPTHLLPPNPFTAQAE